MQQQRTHILTSDQALEAPAKRLGGKAQGLARLVEAGAPVPPFCVVGAGALGAHLEAAGAAGQVVAEELAALEGLDPGAPEARPRLARASARI